MKYHLHLCVMALLCLPCSILLSVINVDVNVYAVGQGNAVLVKGGGHAMLIDAGSNANSLVLKLTVPRTGETEEDERKESRFVFSGDATRETWDHIYASFSDILQKNPTFLRTDYLLLSHHGSPHEGCTRKND